MSASIPNPDTIDWVSQLANELAPQFGHRSKALAKAYDRFCDHHDQARFDAEVRAIKSCRLIEGGLSLAKGG